MKKIIKERCKGKTNELIQISTETRYPILCVNESMKQYIKQEAAKKNLNVPNPISIHELEVYSRGRDIKGLLVDDADLILQRLLQIPIHTLTMSCPTKISKSEIAIRLGLDPDNLEITE